MRNPETASILVAPACAGKLRRAGFTLLEVLLASSFSAMLMVGVLALVAHLGLDQARVSRQNTSDDSGMIVGLIRKDLGRSIRLQSNSEESSMVMEGYAAIDPATLKPTGRAARIIYRVVATQSGPWLVRQQQLLDETPSLPSTEVLSAKVQTMALIPDRADQPGDSATAKAIEPNADQNQQSIPNHLRLHIDWTDSHAVSLDEGLVLK